MKKRTLEITVMPAQHRALDALRSYWPVPVTLRILQQRYEARHGPTTAAALGQCLHALARAGLVSGRGRPEA